ncbi:MAG: endonuclease/exonuclease/phosphatase family protein, partial [Bacteroidota bacterium]
MTVLSKIKKRLIANGLLVVITLLSYGAVYVSPQTYWLAGFMALLIPLWLVLNGLFVFYWLTRRSMYLLLSLSMLMLGATFLQSTLAFDLGTSTKDSTHFSVLSYNVRVFNVYDHLQDEDSASSKEMINWVIEHKAEIKCLQEMYNEDSSRLFNTVERIARSGDYNYYLTPVPNNNQYKGGFFGLAIFSKFPILNSGELPLSENRGNRCLFVDVLIRKDTLRIYNVHLQSMSIDEKSLLENESVAASPYQDLIKRLKRGFEARAKQIEIVEEHLRACP